MVASAGSRSARVPALTKYDVLEELGHGGMATVYRAHDKRLGRDVAVKVLHPHLRESREIAHRFAAEAKAVAKLRHPNIVEVFDVSSEEDSEQYLVVEFVRGETLRRILQKRGALPPEIAAAIAMELLGALSHAHASGVVHRDVKPENVLVEHRIPTPSASGKEGAESKKTPIDAGRGERVFVKLTDFGIAKLLDAQGVTSTGQVLGSPAHMAPEQIEGGEVDGRADVFGIGVLLYECMVGHLPFEGNNPAQVLRRVLDGIYPSAEREKATVGRVWSQILDRALARQVEARFADTEAMREAVSAELARVGIVAPRAELEAYFDDPEGWVEEHDKRLIGKLCGLGATSRRRGDAVAAAADYNRALAYAPDDPQLLKIVASMHRAEARMRLLRRAAPLVLGASLLGVGAYFTARALKGEPITPTSADPRAVVSAPTQSVAPRVRPRPVTVGTTAPSSEHPLVAAIGPTKGTPSVSAPPPATKKRNVTLASLRPPFGVHMAVDSASAPDPSQGEVLTLDDKAHALTFSCESDMCEPRTISVPAGDRDESVSVELHVLPAKLLVDGDPSHSYSIEEMPTVVLGSGVATDIPMVSGKREVTVFDRTDPAQRKRASLRAGQKLSVSFKGP
jgi:serine/threonine protein kinase